MLARLRDWIVRSWRWLVAGLALVLAGVVAGVVLVLRRRDPSPPPTPAIDPDARHVIDAEEARADAVEKKLDAEATKAVDDARHAHEEAISGVVRAEEARVPELVDDPDAVNAFLHDVGKSVR